MKNSTFNLYVEKYLKNYEARKEHSPKDYSVINVIEMSFHDLKMEVFTRFLG